MIDRRAFLATVGSGLAASPLVTAAEPTAKPLATALIVSYASRFAQQVSIFAMACSTNVLAVPNVLMRVLR